MVDETKARTMSERAANLKCQGPDVSQLTPEQLEALHVMKYEMLASLHRLYIAVPPKLAEPFIKERIVNILFPDGLS